MKKTPLVSVLVHTKNSDRTIRNHLESIKNQSYKNIEIIVVDNNSTDKTLDIAKRYTNLLFTYGPERSAQRNFAAHNATGVFFLIPDSDMVLGKDVVSKCIRLMVLWPEIKAIVIPERSIGKGFWARCKALERSFYVGVSWMEGARFFSRKTFLEMGGYDERNTGTEDFDLPQRVEKKYGKNSIGRVNEYITHDEGSLSLIHIMKKKFYYAKDLGIYKKSNELHFSKQASLLRRYQLFFSRVDMLFKNPLVGLGMLCMKTLEFASGGFGYAIKKNS